MKYKYGEFSNEQLGEIVNDLHKKIHRLLYLKENNSSNLYECVTDLIYVVAGLNSLFYNSKEFVDLLIILENLKLELNNSNFDFKRYRKFVLDAHGLVDKLRLGE